MPNSEEEKKDDERLVSKELYSWKAPARPFKKRDREFYITVVAIVSIIGLIIFLAEGAMPVILLISMLFLFYVLSTVPPQEIEYKITNKGIVIAEKNTAWENFTRFWLSKRFSDQLLIFETPRIPGRLELVINEADKTKLREIISKYLPEEEVPPTAIDRLLAWTSRKLPNNIVK